MDWFKRTSSLETNPIFPKKIFRGKIRFQFLKPILHRCYPAHPPLETTIDFDSAILSQLQKFKKEIPGDLLGADDPMFFQKGNPLLGESKKGICIYIYIYIYIRDAISNTKCYGLRPL